MRISDWSADVCSSDLPRRDGRPADTVEAVASGDEIAGQLMVRAIPAEADLRRRAIDVMDAGPFGLEMDMTTGGKPGSDQVLHHLVPAVDRDRLAAGQDRKSTRLNSSH